jgi:hypothetical protein
MRGSGGREGAFVDSAASNPPHAASSDAVTVANVDEPQTGETR